MVPKKVPASLLLRRLAEQEREAQHAQQTQHLQQANGTSCLNKLGLDPLCSYVPIKQTENEACQRAKSQQRFGEYVAVHSRYSFMLL